jgi:hypothetical protein
MGLADQLANFFLVNEQLAGAEGGVVGIVSVVVRANMAVEQP